MMSMISAEQIQANFKFFRDAFIDIDERAEQFLKFIDHFEERIMLCPASSRSNFHRSIPGGLVEHSIRVLKNAMRLNKAFDWKLSKSSLIVASLFHDIGKIGDLDNEYYVSSEQWQKKKQGNLYQVNYNMQFMSVPHRSIFLLQSFGIKLSQDETLAILLNDGFVVEENKDYCLKEPRLATCIWMSDYLATVTEKEEEQAAKNVEKSVEEKEDA